MELGQLINICHQNLLHTQDLQKQANDKNVKPWSYVLGKSFCLNSKYIKTSRSRNSKPNFLDLSEY